MNHATDGMRFASALSQHDDTVAAVADVVNALQAKLGTDPLDLLLVFVSYHHRRYIDLIAEQLADALASKVTLGTTAGGVVGMDHEIEGEPCLSILGGHLPDVTLRSFCYDDLDWPEAENEPELLRKQLLGTASVGGEPGVEDPKALLLFADPFSTPMVKLIPAINRALPGVPVVGGMASGGANAGENRLLLGDRVLRAGAIGVAMGGNIRVDCAISQGCRPIGDTWIITKSRHNIIQEFGRQPVMQAIQATTAGINESDRDLLQQGLFLGRVIDEYKEHFGRGDFLIRNIIGVDQQTGYIAVNDLVRVGQTVQFHVRDKHTAEEDLRELLEVEKQRGRPAAALLCTCNGRGTNLYDHPHTESAVIRDCLGDVPLAGFFAAGEIGPIGHENFLHNLTAAVAIIRPARPPQA